MHGELILSLYIRGMEDYAPCPLCQRPMLPDPRSQHGWCEWCTDEGTPMLDWALQRCMEDGNSDGLKDVLSTVPRHPKIRTQCLRERIAAARDFVRASERAKEDSHRGRKPSHKGKEGAHKGNKGSHKGEASGRGRGDEGAARRVTWAEATASGASAPGSASAEAPGSASSSSSDPFGQVRSRAASAPSTTDYIAPGSMEWIFRQSAASASAAAPPQINRRFFETDAYGVGDVTVASSDDDYETDPYGLDDEHTWGDHIPLYIPPGSVPGASPEADPAYIHTREAREKLARYQKEKNEAWLIKRPW